MSIKTGAGGTLPLLPPLLLFLLIDVYKRQYHTNGDLPAVSNQNLINH